MSRIHPECPDSGSFDKSQTRNEEEDEGQGKENDDDDYINKEHDKYLISKSLNQDNDNYQPKLRFNKYMQSFLIVYCHGNQRLFAASYFHFFLFSSLTNLQIGRYISLYLT